MKLCNESCSVHPVKLYLNILIWFEIVESSKHKLEKKKNWRDKLHYYGIL